MYIIQASKKLSEDAQSEMALMASKLGKDVDKVGISSLPSFPPFLLLPLLRSPQLPSLTSLLIRSPFPLFLLSSIYLWTYPPPFSPSMKTIQKMKEQNNHIIVGPHNNSKVSIYEFLSLSPSLSLCWYMLSSQCCLYPSYVMNAYINKCIHMYVHTHIRTYIYRKA